MDSWALSQDVLAQPGDFWKLKLWIELHYKANDSINQTYIMRPQLKLWTTE